MIAVIQRVNNATVYADGEFSGSVEKGLYILLGVAKDDTREDALLLAEKIAKLRIFSDDNGKMNLSVMDIDGEILGKNPVHPGHGQGSTLNGLQTVTQTGQNDQSAITGAEADVVCSVDVTVFGVKEHCGHLLQ